MWSHLEDLSGVGVERMKVTHVSIGRPCFLNTEATPQGWGLASPRISRCSRWQPQSFHNWISDVTFHHFSHSLFVRSQSVSPRGEDYTSVWILNGEDRWGPSCKLPALRTIGITQYSYFISLVTFPCIPSSVSSNLRYHFLSLLSLSITLLI